ncbi:MAG: PEP-CTERM sorting domain-containing protein [Nitrospirae bacterium]|nr:MAG: PEP-CTERM sorting domain-containing protein [Nitrospirota bacterium]
MKSMCISAMVAGFLVWGSFPAFADFTGPYDVANWTASTERGGSIDLSGAPTSITLTSGDDGSGVPSNQDFTIAAVAQSIVRFAWDYETFDLFADPFFDPFGFLRNGTFLQLTDDNGPITQSGVGEFLVMSGDVFGFRASSFDSDFGPAVTTISEFSVSTVPEPSTLLLLTSGLAGIIGYRVWKGAARV